MRWLTAADLARLWRIPLPTIWRWASEDQWPRTRTRPVRYDPDAAQASLDRRRDGRAETLANLDLRRLRHALEDDRV